MAEIIRRDAAIRIKVHADTKERLERLAHILGVPPATLCAVWIGEAIARQERSLSLVNKMADTVGGEVGSFLRDQLASQVSIFDAIKQAGEAQATPEHSA